MEVIIPRNARRGARSDLARSLIGCCYVSFPYFSPYPRGYRVLRPTGCRQQRESRYVSARFSYFVSAFTNIGGAALVAGNLTLTANGWRMLRRMATAISLERSREQKPGSRRWRRRKGRGTGNEEEKGWEEGDEFPTVMGLILRVLSIGAAGALSPILSKKEPVSLKNRPRRARDRA